MWQPITTCQEYLRNWISERKLTQRVEEIQPGQWSRDRLAEWGQLLQHWRRRHADRRDPERARVLNKEDEEEGPIAAKDAEDAPVDGGAAPEEKAMQVKATAEADDFEKKDREIFAVEDICDIGGGEPLFANFTWEDWMMLNLRFELHLLVHAYRRDVNDPERTSFNESHLCFYYGKYFKKQLHLKYYGVSSSLQLLDLVKNTIEVAPKGGLLEPQLAEDTPLENFIRLTEDHRRERQWQLDAGDQTAALQLQRPPPQSSGRPQMPPPHGGYIPRVPPPMQPHDRGGGPHYGANRMRGQSGGAPSPTRYGGGGYGGGYTPGGYRGGYGNRAGHSQSRYTEAVPQPPPSSRGGGYGYQGGYGGAGGQKRPYPPPPGGGYPPYKHPRSMYGGSYGGGYGGGYRR